MENSGIPQEFLLTVREESRLQKLCEKWKIWLFSISFAFPILVLPGLILRQRLRAPIQKNLAVTGACTLFLLVFVLVRFLHARKKHKIIEKKLNEYCLGGHRSV